MQRCVIGKKAANANGKADYVAVDPSQDGSGDTVAEVVGHETSTETIVSIDVSCKPEVAKKPLVAFEAFLEQRRAALPHASALPLNKVSKNPEERRIAMGKYSTVHHGLQKRIDSMICLIPKQEMVERIKTDFLNNGGTLEQWNDRDIGTQQYLIQKNDYLRSISSITTFRSEAAVFEKWCEDQGIRKFEKLTRSDLEDYLHSRQNLSAWSQSKSMHFCNKTMPEIAGFTKAELGLRSRHIKDVTHSRSFHEDRPGLYQKEYIKEQCRFISGTGARRMSLTRVTAGDFIRDRETGALTQVFLKEKNGKERLAYILPEHRSYLEGLLKGKEPSDKLWDRIDSHCCYHRFRANYARTVASVLHEQEQKHEPYFNREIEVEVKISDHDRERYPHGFTGPDGTKYSREVINLTSQQLGHNRMDVIRHYIY